MKPITGKTVKPAVIEKGKPMPDSIRGCIVSFGECISAAFTLRKMGVGDSFTVDDRRSRNRVLSTAWRLKIKVTTQIDEATGRYCIWRKE